MCFTACIRILIVIIHIGVDLGSNSQTLSLRITIENGSYKRQQLKLTNQVITLVILMRTLGELSCPKL